jgi:hypothetical protein
MGGNDVNRCSMNFVLFRISNFICLKLQAIRHKIHDLPDSIFILEYVSVT